MEGVVRLSAVTAFVIAVLVAGLADAPSARAGQPTPTEPLPIPAAEPSEFLGTVTIEGEPAADGTPIEALIGDNVCGTAVAEDGRYGIGVKAGYGSGADFQEGCGGPGGNTVTFRSGGLIADEEGTFVGMGAQELDLTFGEAPGDPDALPQTGAGGVSEGSAARQTAWMSLLLAAGAMAILAGIAARRAAR